MVTANQLIVGPARHLCIVAYEFMPDDESEHTDDIIGTPFLACRIDETWERTPWPSNAVPFDDYTSWRSYGPQADEFMDQSVWLSADGAIYHSSPETAGVEMFPSPDAKPEICLLPQLAKPAGDDQLRGIAFGPALCGNMGGTLSLGRSGSIVDRPDWTHDGTNGERNLL